MNDLPISTIDTAFETVCDLVKRFQHQEREHLSPNYSEARVRQDFIDRFFEALGWDVTHKYQTNIYQQEVKIEQSQSQEDSKRKKRADYAFFADPDYQSVKFFVEAKKPSRNIRGNEEDYYQTAKYGWNAQTGISILTNFEVFIVLDCRYKPDLDTIHLTEIENYHYSDYANRKKFEKIYWLFSREAVLAGNIALRVKQLPSKRSMGHQLSLLDGSYQTIDDSFLNYIDSIRLEMAQAFFNNNSDFNSDELTEATQRTIDRLVFMRFLEDKQIEGDSLVSPIAESKHPWGKFIATCKGLDVKYNGIVFKPHFIDKPDFLGADETIFKSIITQLEHTNSPYDFNYIPIHILGNIYERFLGKVIEIRDNKAFIEQKPDVRKAGGVYYTPKYIVDYIVKHTVGRIIDGKSLNAIKDIKIADIACGSGSFLIGVYGYLLEHYKHYYNKYESKAKEDKCIYDSESGSWVLTIKQKQAILLNHVYGVDIDQQAVEVTQLSLFLKLLEDESLATANEMQVLFHDKILPDLTQNIQTGNSLIDYRILEEQAVDSAHLGRINPFDFATAFPSVFDRENKGFDILVGNPPYVKVTDDVSLSYFQKYFKHQNYQYDLYLLFLEQFYNVLGNNSLFGVIVPNTWLQSITFTNIRKHLASDYYWLQFLHSDEYIFKDAVVDTHCLVFEKNPNKKPTTFQVDKVVNEQPIFYQKLSQTDFLLDGSVINILARPRHTELFKKIKANSICLGDCSQSTVGVKPFQKGKGKPKQTKEIVDTKPFVKENSPKPIGENWMPLLRGNLMNRYECFWDNNSWIQYGEWLAEPRNPVFFRKDEKIIIRQTADRIIATIIGKDIICRNNLHILYSDAIDHRLILGVLNSKLIDFYYYQINPERGENLAEVKKSHVEQLPMPIITEHNRALSENIIKNVQTLLNTKPKLKTVRTDKEKGVYQKHIDVLEKQINDDVIRIFGLTDEEKILINQQIQE